MSLEQKIFSLIGAICWTSDLGLIAYYVGRHIGAGGKKPSPFTLVVMATCFAGGVYSVVQLAFGLTPWVFFLTSGVSTFLSMVVLASIIGKLTLKDRPPFDEERGAQ